MGMAWLCQLAGGLKTVGSVVLRGAADTDLSFVSNLSGYWLIGMPIALFLGFSRGMGIVGLWWGLCAGLTAVAAILIYRFERLSRSEIVPVAERH